VKKLLDRIGRRGTIVMAVSAVVIAMALQPFLGTDAWAGLGQWAGGLGAFFAAWAALRIAGDERRREHRRDEDQARVRAHYVRVQQTQTSIGTGYRVKVENWSTEPILKAQIVAMHFQIEGFDDDIVVPMATQGGERPVLLPTGPMSTPWEMWVVPASEPFTQGFVDRFREGRTRFEVAFSTVDGTRWRRVGERIPTLDESA
jgi:hypothetical protein